MPEGRDYILEEIEHVREELASRHGFDLDKIVEEIQVHERESGAEFVSLPPRPPRSRAREGAA